jgi:flagellar FliL protein
MADEVKTEETTEQAEVKTAKKGSPLFLIIGIVAAVLLLGGGGFFLYTQMNPVEAAEEGEEVEEVEIVDTNIYFSGFQSNVVNLAVSSDYEFMYLKYGFEIELTSAEVIPEISTKLPRLTASVAGVMSNQDWMEICTPQGRERLGREAMREINDQLVDGQVIGIYFTTFVAQ